MTNPQLDTDHVEQRMDLFDIVILGFDRSRPDSPAAGLQRVFPIDQGTAVRLINALPATVKRGVPQTAAEQYQAALTAIGARVELRIAEPKPAPVPTAVPAPPDNVSDKATVPAAVPAAVLAPSRFTGAATLKQGSPADSVAPPPAAPTVPAATAPVLSAAHLPTERPPAISASAPPAPAVPPAPAEQWGGLVAAKGKAAGPLSAAPASATPASTTPAADSSFPDERETNRQELFRRLMDPRQTGPAELSPAEAAGGFSMLELDLPLPRAGWAAGNETLGADEVEAPLDLQAPLGRADEEPNVPDGGRLPVVGARAPVQVFVPPPDARSFHEALPDAIALSVRDGGARWVLLVGAVGLATSVVLMLLRDHSVLTQLMSFLAAVVLCALVSEQAVWTLRAVVDDLDAPDGPDLRSDDLGRYLSAGFNLLCFGLMTQLPFIAWLVRHRDQLPGALTREPVGLLLLGVSAFYWPMAVGFQAISENPLGVWSLSRGFRVIFAALTDYATTVFAAAIMALLPLGVVLLLTRMGLPAELTWVGVSVGLSLSQGTIAALIGHIARLHPKAFEDA